MLPRLYSRWHAFVLGCALLAAARGESLKICTYNLENYGLADRMTVDGFRPNYPKPENQKAAVQQAIRAINPDVVVMQEMGPPPFLEELRRDLHAVGADYPFKAIALAADAERHVALLSKRPLLATETLDLKFSYFGGVERVKRGVLLARIATPGGDVTIFAVHLKSRLTERRDDPEARIRRAAEATAVRDAILQRFPDPASARFIVLGDFNDSKASQAVHRFEHRGATAIASLLPVADSKGESWTYHYARTDAFERIDHVFVSAPLLPAVSHGTATIYDGDGTTVASDHRPVVVTFDFGGAKP